MILPIDGNSYEVHAGACTLLQVLRDDLGGTKEGCGVSMGGARTELSEMFNIEFHP